MSAAMSRKRRLTGPKSAMRFFQKDYHSLPTVEIVGFGIHGFA